MVGVGARPYRQISASSRHTTESVNALRLSGAAQDCPTAERPETVVGEESHVEPDQAPLATETAVNHAAGAEPLSERRGGTERQCFTALGRLREDGQAIDRPDLAETIEAGAHRAGQVATQASQGRIRGRGSEREDRNDRGGDRDGVGPKHGPPGRDSHDCHRCGHHEVA